MKKFKNIMIIGIDHGFGNIKTAHCCFKSGVKQYDKEPALGSDVLVYDDKYYVIGEEHKEFKFEKVNDIDYYILTLAALAKELKIAKLRNARVHIAAGLPLTWVSEQKEHFREYLLQNTSVDFEFKGRQYHIEFVGADIFPQGFPAVINDLGLLKDNNMLADIGNGTMNIMYIKNGKAVQSNSCTEKFGTNQCMIAIRERLMSMYGITLDDVTIDGIIKNGTADIPEKYMEPVKEAAKEYVEGIMRRLREHGYNQELMKLYVVGGGCYMIKNFADIDPKRVIFNEDIKATAKGYELLAARKLERYGGAA